MFQKIEEITTSVKDNVKQSKIDIGSSLKKNNSKVSDLNKALDNIKQDLSSNVKLIKTFNSSLISKLDKINKDEKDKTETIEEIKINLTMKSDRIENLLIKTETKFKSIKNQLKTVEDSTKNNSFEEKTIEFIKYFKACINDIAEKVNANTGDINLIKVDLVNCVKIVEKTEKNIESTIAENKTAIEYISKISECILKNEVKINKMEKKKLMNLNKKSLKIHTITTTKKKTK